MTTNVRKHILNMHFLDEISQQNIEKNTAFVEK